MFLSVQSNATVLHAIATLYTNTLVYAYSAVFNYVYLNLFPVSKVKYGIYGPETATRSLAKHIYFHVKSSGDPATKLHMSYRE